MRRARDRLGTKWLQSLLDIQHETRDAAEFWDHVKIDLFPDAVYVFTPKSQIMALPRGATVVDFAYAIHSNIGDRTVAAKINGVQVPLRTELKNGDVVEVVTAPVSTPNPAWLGFVRTGRARSKIRHHLKSLAQAESQELGREAADAGAARRRPGEAAGRRRGPPRDLGEAAALHRQPQPRRTADRHRPGQAHRQHRGQAAGHHAGRARREARRLADHARALHRARERLAGRGHPRRQRKRVGASSRPAAGPVPGDAIVGYLGRGEGLVVHADDCAVAKRLQYKDSERFISVEWAEEPVRPFEAGVLVTVTNGKGVLARVAAALASAEADITHVDMGDEKAPGRHRPAFRHRGARPHPPRGRDAHAQAHALGGARAAGPARQQRRLKSRLPAPGSSPRALRSPAFPAGVASLTTSPSRALSRARAIGEIQLTWPCALSASSMPMMVTVRSCAGLLAHR